MKSKNLIPVALIGLGAYIYFAQKKAIALLNYYIDGVALNFDGITPILRLSLMIQNVTNEYYTINSLVGDLYSNNEKIGNVSSFLPVQIMPNSVTKYYVYVRLNIGGIVSNIVNLIEQKSGVAQKVKLVAWINAGGLIAPISLDYEIKF